MDFNEAIKESIRKYFMEVVPERTLKSQDKRAKYTKKYFDELEEEKFGDVTEWDEWQN